jgi:hypothetical protein
MWLSAGPDRPQATLFRKGGRRGCLATLTVRIMGRFRGFGNTRHGKQPETVKVIRGH